MKSLQVICDFEFLCTQRWGDLQPVSGEANVRYCDTCHKPVFLCSNYEELQSHVQQSHCIALTHDRRGEMIGAVWRTQKVE